MKNISAVLALTLVIIVFLAFLPSLQNGFVNWDDGEYVYHNSFIKSASLKNIQKIICAYFVSNYHPLTMLSYFFDYRIFRLNPFGYHLTSLMLHLANCLLVFWLINLLSRNVFIAFITALFFGIHPLHVESVAWISARKDVLSAFFFLAALISYLGYLRQLPAKKYYYLSLSLFIAACLSKSMAVTLPAVLLLIDYVTARPSDKKMFREKIPFIFASLVFGAIGFLSQYTTGAYRHEYSYTFFDKLIRVGYCLIFYLRNTFIPGKLACLYPYPEKMAIAWSLFIAVLVAIFIFALYKKTHSRKVVFGSAFFLITLLPVLQVLPFSETAVADRHTYIPLIGIFYLVGEGVAWLYRKKLVSLLSRLAIIAILIAIFAGLTMLTRERTKAWKDSLALWNDALSKYPGLGLAYTNRGSAYFRNQEFDKAEADFKKAIEIDNTYYRRSKYAYYNLGNLYYARGFYDKATAVFQKASQLAPGDPAPYYYLGNIYNALGNKEEAVRLCEKSIALIKIPAPEACYSLGVLYLDIGRTEEAIAMFNQAIHIDHNFVPAYAQLAGLYEKRGMK